jgi:hypothetical protein
LCPGRRIRRDRGVLRVVALDSAAGTPHRNMGVWVRWIAGFTGSGEHITGRPDGEEQRTDQHGAVVYCDVPANTPLTLSAVNALGRAGLDSLIVRAAGGSITSVRLFTRRP